MIQSWDLNIQEREEMKKTNVKRGGNVWLYLYI
jgi:hypothetical protein